MLTLFSLLLSIIRLFLCQTQSCLARSFLYVDQLHCSKVDFMVDIPALWWLFKKAAAILFDRVMKLCLAVEAVRTQAGGRGFQYIGLEKTRKTIRGTNIDLDIVVERQPFY